LNVAKGSKPSLNGQRSYMSGVKHERDRIVALIEHATEAWVEETPGRSREGQEDRSDG